MEPIIDSHLNAVESFCNWLERLKVNSVLDGGPLRYMKIIETCQSEEEAVQIFGILSALLQCYRKDKFDILGICFQKTGKEREICLLPRFNEVGPHVKDTWTKILHCKKLDNSGVINLPPKNTPTLPKQKQTTTLPKLQAIQYREDQAGYYAKSGLPWCGLMMIRRRTAEEFASAQVKFANKSSCVVEFIDCLMDNGKEDAFAVSSVLEFALIKYKEKYPFISEANIMSDGAGCFKSAYLLLFLANCKALTGVRIMNQYISQAGQGKSQLDAHFAYAMKILYIVVNNGKGSNDVIDAASAIKALSDMKRIANSTAYHLVLNNQNPIAVDDVLTIEGISGWYHRQLQYDSDGCFTGCIMRKSTWRDNPDAVAAEVIYETTDIDVAFPGCEAVESNTSSATKPIKTVSKKSRHIQVTTEEKAKQRVLRNKKALANNEIIKKALKEKEHTEEAIRKFAASNKLHMCKVCNRLYSRKLFYEEHIKHDDCGSHLAHNRQSTLCNAVLKSTQQIEHRHRESECSASSSADSSSEPTDPYAPTTAGAVPHRDSKCAIVMSAVMGKYITVTIPEERGAHKVKVDRSLRTKRHFELLLAAFLAGKENKANKLSADVVRLMQKVAGTEEGKIRYESQLAYMGNVNEGGFPTFALEELLDVGKIKSYFGKSEDYIKSLLVKCKNK
jgi:hypothetical protein